MDAANEPYPSRPSLTNSTTSSRRSSTTRVQPRKYASNSSLRRSDKSFTSFPSLAPSPDSSPKTGQDEYHVVANARQRQQVKVTRAPPSLVENLTARSSSTNDRSALFQDTPQDAQHVPGTLHHVSDDTIEMLLARQGAVVLVRQLAEDLALRDAHVTHLRRRAEGREKVLRKMLRECEVSNLDIEKRLRESDRGSRSRESSPADGSIQPEVNIPGKLSEAMNDSLGIDDESFQDQDFQLQPLGPNIGTGAKAERRQNSSLKTAEGAKNKTGSSGRPTVKGWRDYLWNGDGHGNVVARAQDEPNPQSRISQGQTRRRPPLDESLFRSPPAMSSQNSGATSDVEASLRNIQTREAANKDTASVKSSSSMASWALKLVAGKSTDERAAVSSQTGRSRATTIPSKFNAGASVPAASSTAAGKLGQPLQPKVNQQRGVSFGSNRTIKGSFPESMRQMTSVAVYPGSTQEDAQQRDANLGPVEMDMFVPEETRPPTLVQHHNLVDSQELLTDRFGFIYDQRRKKRQAEAAAQLKNNKTTRESISSSRDAALAGLEDEPENSIEGSNENPLTTSRPATPAFQEHQESTLAQKRWQDYLKLTSLPTELLSHTPSPAPTRSIEISPTARKFERNASQMQIQKRGSLPASSGASEPAASKISSNNAELAQPSAADVSVPCNFVATPADPVKSLLEQLTELHDNLQREKQVRWNEFLRRVRASRRREDSISTGHEGRQKKVAMPEESLNDGELIGIAGLGNRGRIGRAKWHEFKSLVLGGVPVAYRAKVWAECSGASLQRAPGLYEDLVNSPSPDPTIVTQIQMDITRTLTDNIFFRKGPGVAKLKEVLLAYSRHNPSVGYCQGMNLIAACLLLIMPTAEDAFWVLVCMIENILPQGYYDHCLLTSRADQVVLRQYVAELLPKLSHHLDSFGVELEALTFQWFLSVFTDCLSAEALFRVWDVVLCVPDGGGATFLFQVALALLKLNEKALVEGCTTPAEIYHYICHRMTNHAISIDGLIKASDSLRKVVKKEDVDKRRKAAVDREKELIREREAIGNGTSRRKADNDTQTQSPNAHPEARPEPPSTMARIGSNASEPGLDADDNDEEHLQDLRDLTPMPMEEEAQ